MENHISGNLYNEFFSKSNEEKLMAFQKVKVSENKLILLMRTIL